MHISKKTSAKGKSHLQTSDYDILFIKGGWLVGKNNIPVPNFNQDNKEGGLESAPPLPPPWLEKSNIPHDK